MKAVKVAVLAAPRGVSAAPHGVSAALHGVSAAPRGMLAAPHSMLPLQDTHGNSRGPEGPWGGVTIHEKFLWSRIA